MVSDMFYQGGKSKDLGHDSIQVVLGWAIMLLRPSQKIYNKHYKHCVLKAGMLFVFKRLPESYIKSWTEKGFFNAIKIYGTAILVVPPLC